MRAPEDADVRPHRTFRIPMRGYELDAGEVEAPAHGVPNPHEGL